MKKIFNSLGSNYDRDFLKLCGRGLLGSLADKSLQLKKEIRKKFFGQVILTYKGRDAISTALLLLGIGEGDQVITQAFSCHAVETAITRVGAQPVFVDLDQKTYNPGVKQLELAYQTSTQAKAVIIQHTLGIPADIKAISEWCRQHNLWLIEDLAQSVGGKSKDNKKLGSFSDAVVLSFGRDKVVDAISGGACVVGKQISSKKIKQITSRLRSVPQTIVFQDLLYPFETWLIKSLNIFFFDKILHRLFVLIGLLKSPVFSPLKESARMPKEHTNLVLYQMKRLDQSLSLRREKAKVYQQYLADISLHSDQAINLGSNLRYSIKVSDPNSLILWLKKHGIEVADRWYRSAVDSGKLSYDSAYQGQTCPVAEELAKKIVNLPTHEQVSIEDVKRISQLIVSWKDQ